MWIGSLLAVLYGGVCLLLAAVAMRCGLVREYSRKIVHILIGFEWCILYRFIGADAPFFLVALGFTVLLLASYLFRPMPMISSEGENNPGTVYYGVAMTLLSAYTVFFDERMMLPFGIAVFCTSFGDGLAGVAGQCLRTHNVRIYKNKSLAGTLLNFVVSTAVALVFNLYFSLGFSFLQCLILGFVSCSVELAVGRGLDNLLVTFSVALLGYLYLCGDFWVSYLAPVLLTPWIVILVTKKRALTPAGTLGALVLDVIVSLSLGNGGFLLLLFFLLGSGLIDRLKARADVQGEEKKSGTRDLVQVAANGAMPAVAALGFLLTGHAAFALAYIATVAEAFADTAASGIGVFSRHTYDVFRLRRAERGMSGGMSLPGTAASLFAALLVGALALPFSLVPPVWVGTMVGVAFAGAVFDSFLGSLFQVRYRCTVCGKATEKEEHCGAKTAYVSGIRFLDNDAVNFFSGVFAFALALLFGLFVL